MTDETEIILDKATQVAFCSLKKLHIVPFIREDGRVAFRVRGNIAEVLAELAENPSVPILDYLNRLDAVRSVIFTLKNNGQRSSHGVTAM